MKLVELVGLHFEATSGAPLVLLREHDAPHRVLPIFVGGPEAAAIASALSGQLPPRPLTHDVMAALVATVGAHIDAVEVTDLRDGAFLAVLAVSGPDGGRRLDTRPSDGIALALRLGTPLFVSEAVLDEAGTVLPEAPDEEAIDAAVAEFRSVLDDLDPSDFGAPAIGELPAIASPGSDDDENPSVDDSDAEAIAELPALSPDQGDDEDDDSNTLPQTNTAPDHRSTAESGSVAAWTTPEPFGGEPAPKGLAPLSTLGPLRLTGRMEGSHAAQRPWSGLAPTTRLGRWSAALLGVLVVIVTLRLLVESGREGGKDSVWLTGAGSAAFASAVGAMATGWIAILRKEERSLPVVVAVAIGTLVTVFELVELAIPG